VPVSLSKIDFDFIIKKGRDNPFAKKYLNDLFRTNCGPRTEMNYRQVLAKTENDQFRNSVIYIMKAIVELKYKELGLEYAFFDQLYGVLLEF
jgi:hypothetical protein